MSEVIRRIIVGLDASEGSVAALSASADLASALKVELVGVFVEEAHLLALAASGRAVEVDFFSGEARPLSDETLAAQLRGQARRARRLLRRAAEEKDIPWRFEILRGRPEAGLLELAAASDLVVLGERSRFPGRRPGSTVRAVISRGGCRIMVVRRRVAPWTLLQLVWDGSDAADDALALAAGLERVGMGRLVVVAPEGAEGLEERLRRAGTEARVRRVAPWDRNSLVRALADLGPGLVIAPRSVIAADPDALEALLRTSPLPVVLVG